MHGRCSQTSPPAAAGLRGLVMVVPTVGRPETPPPWPEDAAMVWSEAHQQYVAPTPAFGKLYYVSDGTDWQFQREEAPTWPDLW